MRIGPHSEASCANIVSLSGRQLEWVCELRYLGVYFVTGSKFKCSFNNAKKSFYRCFNSIYGRIGTAASAEVILNLIKAKSLPILLYGFDACPIPLTPFHCLVKRWRHHVKQMPRHIMHAQVTGNISSGEVQKMVSAVNVVRVRHLFLEDGLDTMIVSQTCLLRRQMPSSKINAAEEFRNL